LLTFALLKQPAARFERYPENDLSEYTMLDAPDVYGHLFPAF
jgi:hypothetical protein